MSDRAPLRVQTLTAVVTDETTSIPINVSGYDVVSIVTSGTGTITSGVVTIEGADWDPKTQMPYAGTWIALDTVTASDVSGGAQVMDTLAVAAYGFIRTRVSTAIGGGGSISTALRAT